MHLEIDIFGSEDNLSLRRLKAGFKSFRKINVRFQPNQKSILSASTSFLIFFVKGNILTVSIYIEIMFTKMKGHDISSILMLLKYLMQLSLFDRT